MRSKYLHNLRLNVENVLKECEREARRDDYDRHTSSLLSVSVGHLGLAITHIQTAEDRNFGEEARGGAKR